ncbi:tetratricopeptide repeat protein [Roseofilum casamattae]|uniref:Tetratricopeptide repeat protein n=1 Tax=Roseofilum casamattae BLCC-M143 TaxID=3022442 RepID=A0ABT7BT40_9CYAN|nr:tetratricopeptide repeat protein [Roseofilum casamattae]MDJ1182352.1 tetratricopeptide repeat protein [Roseofilum casamattae BLCC-M143]
MGGTIGINAENFATEVMEASYQNPVLVDFFATWCGPCQIVKPVLEKMAAEYDFTIAQIDIDQNAELANTYRVEGVPDIRIALNGDMIPGFVGVLPEEQIRDMLSKFNLKSSVDSQLAAIADLIARQNYPEVKQILDNLFTTHPEDSRVVLIAAEFLGHLRQWEEAEKMLATIGKETPEAFARSQSMKAVFYFQRQLELPVETDRDRQYAQACRYVVEENYETALQELLYFVEHHRSYRQDAGRKGMLAIFDRLGNDRALTQEYRQKLMAALY